jgi:Calpain large subunit, domain III.
MTGNKLKDVAFISVMQPDMRALKHEGKSNNTIGFHVMRV